MGDKVPSSSPWGEFSEAPRNHERRWPMTLEENRFYELLAQLEKSASPEEADSIFPDSPTTLEIEIAIMKSEIFHRGRLKGGKKANVGRRQQYETVE
jgi:hypothetical protein